MRRAALLSLLVVLTVAAEDSPLVEASKLAKQGATPKSKVVITNKSLKKKGGRITTTKSQAPLAASLKAPAKAPEPTAEENAAATQSTSPTLPGLPEPVDDAMGYEPGVDASALVDDSLSRTIPDKIRATPQFSKPGQPPDKVSPLLPTAVKTSSAPVSRGKPLHGVKPQTPQFTKTTETPKQ